jgi:predicted ribosomally synthesized peptide with nif11-like leader
MPVNKNELTKEQIEKAMQCKSVEELTALAKAEGYEITKEEAEAYLEELADVELDGKELKNVAGGGCYADCQSVCGCDWECPHDVRGSR